MSLITQLNTKIFQSKCEKKNWKVFNSYNYYTLYIYKRLSFVSVQQCSILCNIRNALVATIQKKSIFYWLQIRIHPPLTRTSFDIKETPLIYIERKRHSINHRKRALRNWAFFTPSLRNALIFIYFRLFRRKNYF